MNKPVLSAVVVAGNCRSRAQQVIDGLAAQTRVCDIEAIVIDVASTDLAHLSIPEGLRAVYIHPETPMLLQEARATAVKYASSQIIAYLEDHCFPHPDWAEGLITAFEEGDWGCVGYSFTNANPETYIGRANFFSDYGLFIDPVPRGEATHLPGNNVAYSREVLEQFGDQLPRMLSPDFVIQDLLRKRGIKMCLDDRAKAAHQNFESVLGMLGANFHYCRILASVRADSQHWSGLRRLFYGLMVPAGAPVIKLLRLVRRIGFGKGLLQLLHYFPVVLSVYLWSAVGESLGYLAGAGDSERIFDWYEVNANRIR